MIASRIGLRGRLALSHALLALGLVLAASYVLEQQSARLRRSEAATGVERDAEVAARRAERVVDRPDALARLVADERGGGRDVEVLDAEGRVVAGTAPPAAARSAREAAGDALDGAPSGWSVPGQRIAVGAAPLLRGDAVVGAAVLVEPAARLAPWAVGDRQALLPGLALVAVAAGAGWAIAAHVSRPVEELTAAARVVALGGLGPLPPGRSRGAPEVETLRAAVGRMVERTRAMAARAREREARQAVAVRRLCHQLRTPVSVLALRFDELVAPGTDPGRRGRLAEVAGRQLSTLEDLSANFEELARGSGADGTEPVELAALARRVTDRLDPLARSARIRLDTTAGAEAPVVAEAAALEDAVANVVENALKFTPAGGTVRVLVTAQGDDAAVEVADSGPGIPAWERDLVTLPWCRGTAGEAVPGTGLGLSLAADAVARAGGRLEIGDSAGGGALVRLVLPLARR